jgi:hypothetical protein
MAKGEVEFKVVTTTTFRNMDAVEEFLKTNGAFEPHQAMELLDEGTLTIEAEDSNELVMTPTKNVFTIKEI